MGKFLIIGYKFHGYMERLQLALVNDGYDVDLITHEQIFKYVPFKAGGVVYLLYKGVRFFAAALKYDRHTYSVFVNLFSRYFVKHIMMSLCDYKYDAILFVGSRELSPSALTYLKSKIKSACWVLYKWDAESRFSLNSIHRFFDRVASFQKSDSIDGVIYLPNFHFVKLDGNFTAFDERMYDIVAISSYDECRYARFIDFYDNLQPKSSFVAFVSRKINGIPFVQNFPIDHATTMSLYKNSRLVYDFCPKGQTGMSQRVLEALASESVVITDNVDALDVFASTCNVMSPVDYLRKHHEGGVCFVRDDFVSNIVDRCYCTNWFKSLVQHHNF